ncbi:MAG: GNAT family N-acetyltransferase [Holophagae bacterium]|jgi:GNAT superfamily N-acetyltransferase
MRIRQIERPELEALAGCLADAWIEDFRRQVSNLPEAPWSRMLIAEEGMRPRALLAMELRWTPGGSLKGATICAIEVAPAHGGRGIGSRLVRFAEGIARIRGCFLIDVVQGLETWGRGHCWPALGYGNLETGLSKRLESPIFGTCH